MNDKNKNYELYNDLVEVIELKKPEDLNNVKNGYYPNGRKLPIDLKKKCIFRGVSNVDYKLIPNALRKNNDGKYALCDYINSNISIDHHSANFKDIECDDNEKLTLELQYKREFFVLFRFLDWADKSGLKIPAGRKVRKLLHSHINHFQDIGLNLNFMK